MNYLREDLESLDRRVHKARLGVALVRLKSLKYHPPPGRPSIPLQPRKVGYWLEEFDLRGCFPRIPRNRIRAKISRSVLNTALSLSGLTIEDLKDGENLPHLELPTDTLLVYNHGQHRLEAARQHVYPHNVWWVVELLEDDALGPDFAICEQNRNIESLPHNDGTVFRLIEAERSWARAWCSKQAEIDLNAIEKRPALYAALSALRPFVGLWQSFQKGTLHRFNRLKCDHVLIHYLNHIKHTYIAIIDGDHNLADRIDANTIEILEARAPATSFVDREYIVEQFQNGSIFPQVHDQWTRARLLQNVLSISGIIPSIKTFTEDTLWLEDSLTAMKKLIEPGKLQLRDAMRHAWRGIERGSVVLEYADGLTEKISVVIDEESQFEIAFTQLWMFALRNYPRLTSLYPKTDGKYKVAVVGPDPKCLQDFARTASALGFESTLISALLGRDPTRVYIRDMLSKTRPQEQYDYDIEHQEQAHHDLLRGIRSIKERASYTQSPHSISATTDIRVEHRYGRPYDGELRECAPHFFLHNICQVPDSGKFITNLFVKHEIARRFFHMLPSNVQLVLQKWGEEASARGPVESVIPQVETHWIIEKPQMKNINENAAIISELREAQRQIVEQQGENSTILSRLSESHERSARQVEQIKECQSIIAELKTVNGAQTRKDSQIQLEMAAQIREGQETIESMKKVIADHRELQVRSNKASQEQQQILNDLVRSRSEVVSLQQRIAEYKSQHDEQALDTGNLRRQLMIQSQQDTSEKQELQKLLGEWERGERRVDVAGDELSSQELKTRIEELHSANQRQEEALTSSRAEIALRNEELKTTNDKIRGLRKGVERLTEHFVTRLRLESGHRGSNCETIYSEDENSSEGDLVMTEEHHDEIEELEGSIFAFTTQYGRADVPPNTSVEVVEWQKDVSEAELAISDASSEGLEKSNLRMNRMLSMVKRRAETIGEEACNTNDLQNELNLARETIDVQRRHLETTDEQLNEARSKAITLQQEYQTTLDSLNGALKLIEDENEAVRKKAVEISELRTELSTATAENEALRNLETELNTQVTELTEAKMTEETRTHDLEQNLTKARSSLESASQIQKELDKAQSDLGELRKWSSSYIQTIKTAKDTCEKQLEAAKERVTNLEKDLDTAQQSSRTMEEEIRGMKAETNEGDERVRRLKAQLLHLNLLIALEKEKSGYEIELEATTVAVAQAKANTSPVQVLGDLMRKEAAIRADISRVEGSIVQTGVELLKSSNHKVRFQRARTGYERGVDHVAMEHLESMLAKLHDQMVYCFVNGTMVLVEPMRFRDYLANPKQLADDGEFFYCDSGHGRKRRRGVWTD